MFQDKLLYHRKTITGSLVSHILNPIYNTDFLIKFIYSKVNVQISDKERSVQALSLETLLLICLDPLLINR